LRIYSINCLQWLQNRVFIILVYIYIYMYICFQHYSLSAYVAIRAKRGRRKPFNNLYFFPNRFPYFLLLLRLCPNFWPRSLKRTYYIILLFILSRARHCGANVTGTINMQSNGIVATKRFAQMFWICLEAIVILHNNVVYVIIFTLNNFVCWVGHVIDRQWAELKLYHDYIRWGLI